MPPLLEVAGTVPDVVPVVPLVLVVAPLVPLVDPGCVGVVVEVGAGSGFEPELLFPPPLVLLPPLLPPVAVPPPPPPVGSVGSESVVSAGGGSLWPLHASAMKRVAPVINVKTMQSPLSTVPKGIASLGPEGRGRGTPRKRE